MDQWRVPEPRAVVDAAMPDGTVVALRRHGNPEGPRLMVGHGCGLAVDLYYPFWSLLADRFDICVYDLRSHGWNDVTPLERYNIPTLIGDSRAVFEAMSANLGAKPTVGVFHSVSTIIALLHQQQSPDFAGLVLFDPPLEQSGDDVEEMDEMCRRQARRARRRKTNFETREELAEMLGQAPAYSLIAPPTLSLLAETTLRPADGGGYELRCPPEHEGQLYEWYFGFGMQAGDIVGSFDIPMKAIGADPTVQFSFLPGFNLRTLAELDYDFIPDKTHFLQLEAPEECAELTVQFLEKHNLA